MSSLRFFLVAGVLSLALLPATALAGSPVAMTTAGQVRGQVEGRLAVFKGVPFAKPPVGDLRWRAPQPVEAWNGVQDATRFDAACMQAKTPVADYEAISEDCLYLNVWAPEGAKDLPVMVWIHGGSLSMGAGHEPFYDGAALAREGLVVVTINYRLGLFGWLAHPALSAETPENISGNYGLLDQIAALEWVRDNIAAFGGDAGRVTIAGESAGALSVMYLMTSPRAEGLFHGAIAQSPYMITSPVLRDTPYVGWPDSELAGTTVATALGAQTADELRALSADEILAKLPATGYFPMGTVDGHILPKQVIDAIDAGEQAKTPVLAGFNEGEIRSLRILLPPKPETQEDWIRKIRAKYGDLAGPFLKLYSGDDLDASMLAATRDGLYGWSAERLVEGQQKAGLNSYLYYWDHGYPAQEAHNLRAFHASEIPYIFGTADRLPAYWPRPPATPEEEGLSRAMTRYWASFVKTGRPLAEGESDWPAYGDAQAYLHVDDRPAARVKTQNSYELHEEVVCRLRASGDLAWFWNIGLIAPSVPQTETCSPAFNTPAK